MPLPLQLPEGSVVLSNLFCNGPFPDCERFVLDVLPQRIEVVGVYNAPTRRATSSLLALHLRLAKWRTLLDAGPTLGIEREGREGVACERGADDSRLTPEGPGSRGSHFAGCSSPLRIGYRRIEVPSDDMGVEQALMVPHKEFGGPGSDRMDDRRQGERAGYPESGVDRSSSNHFFDALYYATAASWYCGVRVPDEPQVPEPRPRRTLAQTAEAARPDGTPWIDRER